MKKSVGSVFLAPVILIFLLNGCAPAETPVPPTLTSLPPTETPIPPTATPSSSGLEGSVFWSATNKPITDFTITLEGANSIDSTTDGTGRYSFKDLKPGTYSISIAWNLSKAKDIPCQQFDISVPPIMSGMALSLTGTNDLGENIFISVGLEIKIDKNNIATADFKVNCN